MWDASPLLITAVAMDAEHKNKSQYHLLEQTHLLMPVAVETLGAMGPVALSLLKEIARCVTSATGEDRAH